MMTIATNDLYIAADRYKVRPIAIWRNQTLWNVMTLDIDEVIKALAHPVRRDILHWLKDPQAYFADQDHPLEIGVCAGKIDQRTGLSQSTVSAHLATLQRAGLISSKKVGQWHFFKRNEETIQAFLSHICQAL
jgi:DNA-binding transcriptional ArsR family regulator